jgi:hypothetical protein
MLSSWDSILSVRRRQLWILVRQGPQADILKARLPCLPQHPRALLTLKLHPNNRMSGNC